MSNTEQSLVNYRSLSYREEMPLSLHMFRTLRYIAYGDKLLIDKEYYINNSRMLAEELLNRLKKEGLANNE